MAQADEKAAGNASSALGSALLLPSLAPECPGPKPRAEIPLGQLGILQASVTSLGCCPVTKTPPSTLGRDNMWITPEQAWSGESCSHPASSGSQH